MTLVAGDSVPHGEVRAPHVVVQAQVPPTPTYRVLDHTFRFVTPEPLHSVIVESFRPLQSDADPIEMIVVERQFDHWCAFGNVEPLGRTLERLLEHVNARAAASLRMEVPLHGAAVCSNEASVLALVGRSGSGKSTLGLAATLAGRWLVAEEITAVGSDRTVRAYHRPVGLRRGGAAALGIEYPEFDDGRFDSVFPMALPSEQLAHGGVLRGIALVDRHDGRAHMVEVPPARALAQLVEHTVVPDDDRVVSMFRRLEQLVRQLPVVRLSYQHPADGVRLLDELESSWIS